MDLQQETLELTQFRAQAGLATDLDVQQALSNVESTRAQIASLESGRTIIHAIAILLGRPPAELNAEFSAPAPIPEAPIETTLGACRRASPSSRRAWCGTTAGGAGRTGECRERISIRASDLPDRSDWSRCRLPSCSCRERASGVPAPRPAHGCSIAGSSARTSSCRTNGRSRRRAATKRVVLRALQEVEDSLIALAQEQVRRGHLVAATSAAQQAADLSLQLYTAGLRDFRDVLDGQRSLLTLQDSLASSSATVSSGSRATLQGARRRMERDGDASRERGDYALRGQVSALLTVPAASFVVTESSQRSVRSWIDPCSAAPASLCGHRSVPREHNRDLSGEHDACAHIDRGPCPVRQLW